MTKKIVLILTIIGCTYTCLAQKNFNTNGVIIIDTIDFKGAIHLFTNNSRAIIIDDTSIAYNYSPKSCLLKGGAVFIHPTFFNLIIDTNIRNSQRVNIVNKKLEVGDFISANKYIFNKKIIVGIISSDDFDKRLMDYFPLNIEGNIPIWVFTNLE